LVAEYKAYFENIRVTDDFGGKVLDSVFYDEPSEDAKALELASGEKLSTAGFYFAVMNGTPHVSGISTVTVDIYVPVGEVLVIDDEGVFRSVVQSSDPGESGVPLVDEETGVSVSGLADDVELSVKPVDGSDGNFGVVKDALAGIVQKFVAFDISLFKGDAKVQPGGKVEVRVPLPVGYDERRSVVYHVGPDGAVIPVHSTAVKDGGTTFLVFEVVHFSVYVVAQLPGEDLGDDVLIPTGGFIAGDTAGLWLFALVLLCGGGVVAAAVKTWVIGQKV
jgi:hypothetical protein